MEMETEYDELLEVLAYATAAASITGRNLPQKHCDLLFDVMDLPPHPEPAHGTGSFWTICMHARELSARSSGRRLRRQLPRDLRRNKTTH